MNQKNKYWILCSILVIILAIIGFTPLVIPVGVYKPTLAGIPYTLWMSFLITLALVALTFVGSKVHPGRDEEEGKS